jgi:sterol desaturase/sphingolipid hydroxylase (fatty acid hydroxylase superfamily)
MDAMRGWSARLAFPVVLGGALLWTAAGLRAGVSPDLAVLGPFLVPAAIILILERLFPHHRSWQRSRGDVHVDLAHAVSVGLTLQIVQLGLLLAALPLAAALAESRGAPFWPADWPWGLQLALALVVAELPKYWLHRFMHEHDALWRFHATHHSVPRLYWLNATRFHPVDIGLDAIVGLTPLLLLGCGPEVLALFGVLSAVHGFFQHANLELRLGPLNYIFSMAELHRWHHSKTVAEANHNYGQNVILWDLVFGTFFWPRDREPPEEIGIDALPAFPAGFWAQLASPFRWARLQQEAAAAREPDEARS